MYPAIRAASVVTAIVPAFLFARPVSAQTIVGVWESSVPTRISNEGGTETPSNFVTVTMTIDQRGDSIFATSLRGPAEGLPPATSRMFKGTFKGGTATLVSPPTQANINRDGEESTIEMITTFEKVTLLSQRLQLPAQSADLRSITRRTIGAGRTGLIFFIELPNPCTELVGPYIQFPSDLRSADTRCAPLAQETDRFTRILEFAH